MPWKRSGPMRRASSSSLTMSAPPSIDVMFLFGWKLNVTRSPKAPTLRPRQRDPITSAASSITRRPCRRGGEPAFRGAAPKGGQRGFELLHPRPAGELARAQGVGDAGDGRLVEHGGGELKEGKGTHRRSDERQLRATSHTPATMNPI